MTTDKILDILNSFEKGSCIVVTFYDEEFVIRYEGIAGGSLVMRNGVLSKKYGYRPGRGVFCCLGSVQNVREATCEEADALMYYINNH